MRRPALLLLVLLVSAPTTGCVVDWTGQSGSYLLREKLDVTRTKVIEQARIGGFEPKRPWWYPYDARTASAMARFGRVVAADSWRSQGRHIAALGRNVLDLLSRTPRL